MNKGKFEARKGNSAKRHASKPNLALPIFIGVAALAVLAVGIWLLAKGTSAAPEYIPDNVSIYGVDLGGMTEQEAIEALTAALPAQFDQDLSVDMGEGEVPVVIRAAQAQVSIDPAAAAAAARRATFDEEGNCVLDTAFVTVDETYLSSVAQQAVADYSRPLQQPTIDESVEVRETEVTLEDGTTQTQDKEYKNLVITTGVDEHSFTEEEFCACVREGYATQNYAPQMKFKEDAKADRVNVEELSKKYCTEPVNAQYDPKTFEITPDVLGYGFDAEELTQRLSQAKQGEEIIVVLKELQAEVTVQSLKDSLFSDVLGECDTPHTYITDRTRNLELACAAINGTVLMPGETFSFNETVGQRTKEKGYREAIAYVSGKSVPEVGGGVCQVASTIYSACLYADLEIVQAVEHQFFVTYVNPGMDATIYWPRLDYKFRNNTEYPLRIDASVHDGRVWVSLMGTNTRDYTVKMSWETVSTTPWNTVEQEIKPGDSFKPGEVITTPYTGYKVITYMSKYDLNGNLIGTTQVRVSNYSKRDKVVAVAGSEEPTVPSESSSTPTAEPTEPTAPTAEPTEPTAPPTQPTEPIDEPTEPTNPPEPPSEEGGEG